MRRRRPDELGFLETLGAWLGVWTTPQGTDVPPVPWRKLAVGSVILVVAGGMAGAYVLPRLSDERQELREREQRAAAERRAAFLARLDREQRPRRARGAVDPGAGVPAHRRIAARRRLVAAAEAGIARDAARRSGERMDEVTCEPFPRPAQPYEPAARLGRRAAAYGCVAVTARFDRGDGEGVIGLPFRLVVRFAAGRYAWCRIVPLPDRDRLAHPLPDACRLR